jgi:hypothetical protein
MILRGYKMTKLGRPKSGNEVKKVTSIRVEPRILEKIKKKYGSLQKFFDGIINGEIHPYHNYISVKKKDN